MKNGKKCYCLVAVLAAIAVIILVGLLHGYGIAQWTATSWVGGLFILAAFFFCARCRLAQEEDEQPPASRR